MRTVTTISPPITERKRLWGGNVKCGRELIGLSQTALAELCEVTQQTISSVERGEYAPRDDLKVSIAEALRQDVGALFPLTRKVA